MVANCVVKKCPNKGKTTGVRFHRFPKDAETRQKWIDFVANEHGQPFAPTERQVLCSQHFDENNYISNMPKWRGYPTISLKRGEPHQLVLAVLATGSENVIGEEGMSTSCVETAPVDQSRKPLVTEDASVDSFSGVFEPQVILHTDDVTSEASDPEISTHTLDITCGPADSVPALVDTSEPGPETLHSSKTESISNEDGDHNHDVEPISKKCTKLNSSSSDVEKVSSNSKDLCTSCGQPVDDMVRVRVVGKSAEEVAELQSLLRSEKRIAYPRDVTLEDLRCPNSRVRCYNILMGKLDEYEKRLHNSQRTISELRRKVESLESLVAELQDKNSTNVDTSIEDGGPNISKLKQEHMPDPQEINCDSRTKKVRC